MKMVEKVPPKIYEMLGKVVSGDIKDYVISAYDSNKKGEGYLGQIFFISLQNRDTGKQFNLVVKQAFEDQNVRDYHPIREAFENEINFYMQVWPKLAKFQETIPPKDRFYHLAKCFGATCEELNEILVFENLKNDNFVLHDKKIPLGKDQFEFIFKVYGKFHAISLAYKAFNPEGFSKVVSNVKEVWQDFREKESFNNFLEMLYEEALEHLHSDVDDDIIDKYKKNVADGAQVFFNYLINGKNTVLIHGDCWSNNMMFKYNESGKLVDLRLIDFQLVRLGSPVCDLSYCLYSGGTKEIFDKLDYFLQIYHDSLSDNLKEFGCDPNELYPWEELKNDWKTYCGMGMILGLMIWRIKLTSEDSTVDLVDISNDNGDLTELFKTNYDQVTFKQRTRDIIIHLYENNYL